ACPANTYQWPWHPMPSTRPATRSRARPGFWHVTARSCHTLYSAEEQKFKHAHTPVYSDVNQNYLPIGRKAATVLLFRIQAEKNPGKYRGFGEHLRNLLRYPADRPYRRRALLPPP